MQFEPSMGTKDLALSSRQQIAQGFSLIRDGLAQCVSQGAMTLRRRSKLCELLCGKPVKPEPNVPARAVSAALATEPELQPEKEPSFLLVAEIATILGISNSAVRKQMRLGTIPGEKDPQTNRWRILAEEFEAWLPRRK